MTQNMLPSMTPAARLPRTMQGEVYQNVGKYARGAVLYAFEAIGGADGLSDWAKDNPDDFYTKLFPKIITKEVEVNDRRGVDDLMDLLDADYEVVQDGGGPEPSAAGGAAQDAAPAAFPVPRHAMTWDDVPFDPATWTDE